MNSDFDQRDFACTGGGLPCDLPLKEPRRSRRPRGGAPHRTPRLAVAAALAVLLVAVVASVIAVRTCDAQRYGAVAQAAGRGGVDAWGYTVQTARDVQQRAVRGEGLVDGTVCIDAGHGGGADLTLTPIGPGSDEMQYVEPGGTAGVATGREEAVVTLEIAKLLRDKLEDAGVTVAMVREDNETAMSSEQRAAIANEAGADIFLRLHCNGSDDPSAQGFMTLVPGYNDWTADIVESSAYAASIMHPIVVAKTGAVDAGVVERVDLAGFNFCDVPSLLFEMGFMSNSDEDVRLSDPSYQDLLAQALCDATIAYLEAVSSQ